MSPSESDSEMGSSGCGSDEEATASSGTENVDTQTYEKMSSKTWKKQLFDKLGEIDTFGDFACMNRYSHHINPGLEVVGSPIPLPLVSRDASTIKSNCEQAPFGRGEDTLVDESVRKTWQLDHGLYRCSNPSWPAFLEDTVLRDIVQKLGMPQLIRAVPHKLLLYEEGSFFRPHKDSEKAPGMIGTLVISLPSKHHGAEVHLSHSNRRQVFATSDFSEFDLTALAWYSDVTHEIKPLKFGHRLVMTYNLISQGPSTPSARWLIEQQDQLQGILQKWTSASPSVTKVIYMLEYEYSKSSLSIQNMKGNDAQIVRCLRQACPETGHHLLLATMTRIEHLYEDDSELGLDENSLKLDHVANLEGNFIAGSVNVDMKDILGPDPYEDRGADSEDEGGFTGNESMPSEYRYHDSALLIVSTKGLIDLVKSSPHSAANLFSMVYYSPAVSEDRGTARHEAIGFLNSLLENAGSTVNHAVFLSMALRACSIWSCQELYNKTLRRALLDAQRKTNHNLSYLSLTARPSGSPTAEIAKGVAEFINYYYARRTDQDWNECLGELVQGLDASSLNEALEDLERRLNNELRQSFRCWRVSAETSKFETKDSLTALDLPYVLFLIQSHLNDDEWVSVRLLPKLSERAEKGLLYALLHTLCAQAENGQLALKHTESLANRLLKTTLPKLDLKLDDLEPELKRPSQGSTYLREASNGTGNNTSNPTKFPELLQDLFMCGLEEQGMELLRKSYENLSEAISRLPPTDPKRHITDNTQGRYAILRPQHMENDNELAKDFLASLVNFLQRCLHSDPPSFVKDLFLMLFTRYILPDHPGNPPPRPNGWSRKQRFCYSSCDHCARMQDYISSPTKIQGRFPFNQKIRDHLERVLPRQLYQCETDTASWGRSYVLVVTKIGGDTEFDEEMKKYDKKLQLYERWLLSFRRPVMQRLLGDGTYRSLILMETAPPAVSTGPVLTKRAASESLDQPAPTRQRADGVIDLTGE